MEQDTLIDRTTAIYRFVSEFRNWQRDWDSFEKQDSEKKPKHLDDFVSELERKYVVGFKHQTQ